MLYYCYQYIIPIEIISVKPDHYDKRKYTNICEQSKTRRIIFILGFIRFVCAVNSMLKIKHNV